MNVGTGFVTISLILIFVLAPILLIGVVGGFLGIAEPSLVIPSRFKQTRRNVFLIYILGPIMLNPLVWMLIEGEIFRN